jgi:RluA family pseudouridine synthase
MRRLALTTTEAHRGVRLDHALAAWLPEAVGRPLSKSAIRRLLMAGAVRMGGRPLRRPGLPLGPGMRLEARIDEAKLASSGVRDRPAVLDARHVLYEDAALVAVDKPPGLPMHATADATRAHLVGLVEALVASRGGPTPRLGVHQRLDRDTSGVVLFTKDAAANAPLARAFAGREVEKTYLALCRRPKTLPPRAWSSRGDVADASAETAFRVREVLPGALLVEARPKTGRKHQIRVHLAEARMAILGDDVYGVGATPEAPRILLHAARLALRHPLSGLALVIESPLPADFRRALAALRRPEVSRGRSRRPAG